MSTKKGKSPAEQEADKYKIKVLTFGDRNRIKDESLVIDEKGRTVLLTGTQRFLTIKLGVRRENDKELPDDMINGLDEEVGQILVERVRQESKIPLAT